MINPWGGVEAMLTHAISMLFGVPSAHSPMMTSKEVMNLDVGICDPRKAAEAVSNTYLHCILRGLHRSPRIVEPRPLLEGLTATLNSFPGVLTAADVSCLVIPQGCLGLPTLAALEQGIPVIEVRNKNIMRNYLGALPFQSGRLMWAENYIEVAGLLVAMREGVAADAVRRPLADTRVEIG